MVGELENLAFYHLRKTIGPKVLRKGFRREAIRAIRAEYGLKEEDVCESLKNFHHVPDAFFIQVAENEEVRHAVVAIEIEDTHSLDVETLHKYCNLWFDIEDTGDWTLRVLVCDRYGLNVRELPLLEYHYSFIDLKINREAGRYPEYDLSGKPPVAAKVDTGIDLLLADLKRKCKSGQGKSILASLERLLAWFADKQNASWDNSKAIGLFICTELPDVINRGLAESVKRFLLWDVGQRLLESEESTQKAGPGPGVVAAELLAGTKQLAKTGD
jgi:hypothetical protein